MKRNWLLFILLCGCLYNIFSESVYYKVIDDILCTDGDSDNFTELIKKDSVIEYNLDDYFHFTSFLDTSDKSMFWCKYKNKTFYTYTDMLELCNSKKLLSENNSSIVLTPKYYIDFFKDKNFSRILSIESYWKQYKEELDLGKKNGRFADSDFYDDFQVTCIEISNLFVSFAINRNTYVVKRIKIDNGYFVIDLYRRSDFAQESYYPDSYLKYAEQSELKLFVQFDGDFVSIWVNSLNDFMGKYAVIDEATYKEIRNLVRNRSCDLSKVTWPRHADGSCNYDKEIKPPKFNFADIKVKSEQPNENKIQAQSSVSTNVTKNKTMTVKENLKLRSGEATSTQVLTVMQTGTKVKILELGKAEKIDGINSNWGKVEVQKNAKDRDGKPIKAGTVGWCYGGYLE